MDVMLELASEDEKKVISWALAIALIATDGIGEWKSKREALLARCSSECIVALRLTTLILIRRENCWRRENSWGT